MTHSRVKPKLLITGASGFLGSWLCEAAQAQWQVTGLYNRKPGNDAAVNWVQADLCELGQLDALIAPLNPQAVIHLAAISNTPYCEAHPTETAKLNVAAAIALAQTCAQQKIPFIFTSSDLVFDGENSPYKENAPVNPQTVYGQQKAQAEAGVMAAWPEAIVARMPLMFGFGKAAPNNFMTRLLEALKTGEPLTLFDDEIRNPLSAKVAAQGLLFAVDLAMNQRHRGLLHIGGPEAVSRYALGIMLAEAQGYSSRQLQACSQDDIALAMARPKNVCTDCALARSLGFSPPSLREQLADGA
jgi:dTDP-4-dehydrorhamnose reductase